MSNAARKLETETDHSEHKIIELEAISNAINRVQAVIEFNLDGTILTANENFLKTLGYSLDEIRGKHHRMFCDPATTGGLEYARFWDKLNRGEFDSGEYKRINKAGKEIWIQASYNPVFDENGKVYKVVKFATDITAQKLKNTDSEGRIQAVSKSQAVIEFGLDGIIVDANENFLKALGYSLDEIKGKHHRMFVEPSFAAGAEYARFWDKLNHGEFEGGEYKRIAKGGKEIWINATYNPIFDLSGKAVKVVKYATDITAQKLKAAEFESKVAAISKAQAVIEFNLDGTIIEANDNFLGAIGYSQDEIKGKHHRMFVDPSYAASPEYARFWEKLRGGDFDSGEYKRIGKGGKEIWIQASYNPVFDMSGKPFKVVKYATDVSAQKLLNAVFESILQAQAVIEFNMDGSILSANDKFLTTMGFDPSDIQGRHHRFFNDPQYVTTFEYQDFWEKLKRGQTENGEYKTVGKNGKMVWLQATYKPILDLNGKPFKVIMFSSDVTPMRMMINSLEDTAIKLATSAADLKVNAMSMNENAKTTSRESETASSASNQVFIGVQTVAASTEEMVASIREISRSANESAEMSRDTLASAQLTNRTISQLGASSLEIGNVIKVISSIAQQTNLLALNATIEAARAGDAGKGFAVVANEVKELAKQTAKATEDITNRIGAIQKDSQGAVEAIGGISKAMEKLNSISCAIAAAVEEQTATTNEVSRVIGESKRGVESIANTIKEVSSAAQQSAVKCSSTLDSSEVLAQLAEQLKSLVKQVQK
jgi:methyl-accepting chemotaxis protein